MKSRDSEIILFVKLAFLSVLIYTHVDLVEKYVGLVPTYYAAVRLAMHCVPRTLTFHLLS